MDTIESSAVIHSYVHTSVYKETGREVGVPNGKAEQCIEFLTTNPGQFDVDIDGLGHAHGNALGLFRSKSSNKKENYLNSV